jgi:hypothetical protein
VPKVDVLTGRRLAPPHPCAKRFSRRLLHSANRQSWAARCARKGTRFRRPRLSKGLRGDGSRARGLLALVRARGRLDLFGAGAGGLGAPPAGQSAP